MEKADEEARTRKFMVSDMVDETLLPEHRTNAEIFQFVRPDLRGRDRAVKKLCLSDVVFAGVQILEPGARNIMHSHYGADGIFFVLKGRIAFYGSGDVLIGEIGPMEGMLMPRQTKYWFEAVGDEIVEMLHVEAFDKRVKNKRTNYPEGSSIGYTSRFKPEDVIV